MPDLGSDGSRGDRGCLCAFENGVVVRVDDLCVLHSTKPGVRITSEHRQVHRAAAGDSECTCRDWVGPMTTLPASDPRSFGAHLASVETPEETR